MTTRSVRLALAVTLVALGCEHSPGGDCFDHAESECLPGTVVQSVSTESEKDAAVEAEALDGTYDYLEDAEQWCAYACDDAE